MRKKKEKNVTYVVVGLGRFGSELTKELFKKGAELIVVDNDEEKISNFRKLTENAYIIDNIDRDSLKKIGADTADVAVVCIGDQIDASILITLDLVSLGIPKVIAKASNSKHGLILEKIGAEVVYPERDMAIRLANRLENTKTLDYIRLSERINISKIKVTEKGHGISIIDLKIRQKYGCNIIAVERGTYVNDMIFPEFRLQKGDIVYVTGSNTNLEQLVKHI